MPIMDQQMRFPIQQQLFSLWLCSPWLVCALADQELNSRLVPFQVQNGAQSQAPRQTRLSPCHRGATEGRCKAAQGFTGLTVPVQRPQLWQLWGRPAADGERSSCLLPGVTPADWPHRRD